MVSVECRGMPVSRAPRWRARRAGPRAAGRLAAVLVAAGLLVGCAETPESSGDGAAAEPGAPAAVEPPPAPEGPVPLREGLGDWHHPITTSVPEAQAYFDQGVRLHYAFDHDEAVRSFRHAAALDTACAMCWWGVALSLGPNVNLAMSEEAERRAAASVREAEARMDGVTPRERAYVEALAARYGLPAGEERARRDSAYAAAMGRVAEAHPEDPDAQVLHAEALMALSPWDYWREDGEPRPDTPRILERLERVTEAHPEHAGACHLYIHAVEAARPALAEPCADRLAGLMPGAGHIVHMPAHIYVRVGRYADAIEANLHAVHADEAHLEDRRPGGVYPTAYYPHNYHFLAFAAFMAGRAEVGMEAARALAAAVDTARMREPETRYLQHFWSAPLRAAVRFGRWDDALRAPEPAEGLLYPRGVWQFARGMARVRRGEPERARERLAALREEAAEPELEGFRVGVASASEVLRIAEHLLAGELALHEERHEEAVRHHREAVVLEDGLRYTEPPDWEIPPRHFLGAALVAAGRRAEAVEVYHRDLERFPRNGWSLRGLAAAYLAMGSRLEAAEVMRRYREAWEGSELSPTTSRL